MKNNKALQWIIVIIVVAISLYQFMNEDASSEPLTPEPATATSIQVEPTDTYTPQPAPDIPETDTPGVPEPSNKTASPPTATSTETSVFTDQLSDDFDFFVMALSWSPDYCASTNNEDGQQCSIGKKLDFVLHGLWPQYNRGYPSYCSTETMPDDLIDEFPGLYPSISLYDHEWKKHGTCTGLDAEGYFLLSKNLKESVVIPAEYDSPEEPFRTDADGLKEAFAQVNPEFSTDALAVYCSGSGRFLKELFVCFSKDGQTTGCSAEVLSKASKSCGQPDFLVRNTR